MLDEETLEHIQTLNKLRNEKENKLQNLELNKKSYSKTSDTIHKILNNFLFVPVIIYLLSFLIINHFSYEKIKMFYNDNQVIFWILAIIFGSTTIGGLFKQCRVLIEGWLFNIFLYAVTKK